jgi:glycosyltransferase involved in cell wall biosynthesis
VKISIITVTYNSAATLEQTIRSVIGQTYKNIEYIIVDGKSTDGTLGIVEKYISAIAKVHSEKDEGLYDGINKGIAMATGDVIGILHSDDFYANPDVLQRYSDAFTKTGADAVYADLHYVDRNNTSKIVRTWKSGQYKSGSFLNGWMPPHPTFFARTETYRKLGIYDLQFKTAADYELMLRFVEKHKIKLAYLPYTTVKMRTGGVSNASMKNRVAANLEDRKAWEKNGLRPRFYTLYLKPLRKLLQFF